MRISWRGWWRLKARSPVEVLPAQLAVLNCTADVISRPAGYGSGKSWGLCLWAVYRAYQNAAHAGPHVAEPLKGILVEPTLTQVNRVLLPALREVCGALGQA